MPSATHEAGAQKPEPQNGKQIESEIKKDTVRGDAVAPERIVTVLAISPHAGDRVALGNIFAHTKWQVFFARSWREAQRVLAQTRVAVIICERELEDGSWKTVLGETGSQPGAPTLIVTALTVDDVLWAEVLNLGCYDLLMKPFDASEVFRVVGLAWFNWRSRMTQSQSPARAACP